jgi:serine protease Do
MKPIALVHAVLLIVATVASARAIDVPQSVLDAQQERIAAMAIATKCSISVFAKGGGGGGSGVLITADGYALTNYHVVQPCGDHMKCSLPEGKLYDAVIVGIDPVGDVALIKLLGRDDFPIATIADSDKVRVGDWCFAIGNPFLLATDFQPTITYGIVSGVHRYQYPAGTLLEYADCLQTDASINPGNSGGPLFNARGELIGVNGRGSFEKRGRVNVGVGYAISINQIQHFLGDLRSGRIVDHATLGASVATDSEGRVLVTNILESSDAYRRGLRYGDEITSFGGRAIGTTNAFKNVMGIFPKGWRVPLSFARKGERHEVHVRLAGVHSAEELLQKVQNAAPKEPDEPKEKPKPSEKPLPLPMPAKLKPVEPLPPEIAKLIKHKSGYANYHFNEVERDRTWQAFMAKCDVHERRGTWELNGTIENGGDAKIKLTDNGVSAMLPDGAFSFDAQKDFDAQLEPRDTGLLIALHVWRRMLVQGPSRFGDVYYHGTVPLPGIQAKCDVLVGTHNVVETRFLFTPEDGRLAAVEMFADANTDPCELTFSDYRAVDGCEMPYRIEVRHHDKTFAVLNITSVTFGSSSEKAAP